MKFLRLILINARRSKRRTILTILGVMVSLFLFSTLRTVTTSFQTALEVTDATRLIVRNATSIIFSLPISYRDKIAAVPGVVDITWGNWFGGIYIDERNFFAQFGVDAESYFRMYPELVLSPEAMTDFMAERNACVVGEGLARKFGWNVGDRIVLKGTIYPGQWDFVIRGIYTRGKADVDVNMFYFHDEYLEENSWKEGETGFYAVRIDDHRQAARVCSEIDRRFTNSMAETKTETEEAFQLGFFEMLGNIELLLNAIGGAVIFTIILVTMNTMMMAGRERIREIAVMKTVGFANVQVFLIILSEAALIALIGGGLGCGLARAIYDLTHFTLGGFVPSFVVRGSTIAIGMGISLFLGLVSGIVPAVMASRLRITEALRHVG
jgi:putative ABC transport system permease protein